MSEPRTPQEWAAAYRAEGRIVLPIPAGTKRATVERWSDPTATEFGIGPDDNLAWRLDGVLDFDLDTPLARRMARFFLPAGAAVCGRPGAGDPGHYFYACDALAYEKFSLTGIGTVLELRTGPSHYTIVPPSLMPPARGLPSENLAWVRRAPLASPDPLALARAARLLAAAVGLAHGLGKWGYGHDARLDVAGFLLRLDLTEDEAILVGEAISGPCENNEVSDVATAVRSTAARLKVEDKGVSGGPSLARRMQDGERLVKEIAALFGRRDSADRPWTESGDAETFAGLHGDYVRHDHRRGRWLLYRGHAWRPQTDAEVERLSLDTVRHRQKEAMAIDDDADRRKKCMLWAIDGESARRRANLITLAKTVKPISDPGDRWDADPWLLGAPNGVVDLRTGELRPGRPEDRITMQSRFPYDPAAKCPLWEETILAIFGGDERLVAFVQRAFGYSITGDMREEALFVCWGSGANGKGTLMNTVAKVLGDYADDLPFSSFELGRNGGGIPNDIAKIDGKRYVTSSETGDTVRLNENRIKALTGRDPITARFLHKEFFTFDPVSKIWFSANQRPEVRDDSDGFWRRVHLIPFLQSFKNREDKTLKDRLLAEGPGILRWLVEGALAWQMLGLQPPDIVKATTESWKEESDPLAEFFADRCVVTPSARVGATVLYEEYKRWASAAGIRDPLSQKAFGTRARKQFSVEEGRHVRYVGVGLKDDKGGDGGGPGL